MPRNLELKARLSDFASARRIAGKHALRIGVLQQTDFYFRTETGRLKLRRFSRSRGELISYRRKEMGGDRWSDYLVLPVNDPDGLTAQLKAILGLRATIRKRRLLYTYRNARIHLDRIETLGAYLEFEVPVTRGERQAKNLLKELKKLFGISVEQTIRVSYVDLAINKAGGTSPRAVS